MYKVFLEQKELSKLLLAAFKACGILKDIETGRILHLCSQTLIHETNKYLETSLIDMYVKCGSMPDAQKVFDKSWVCMQDVVPCNALIMGYVRNGESLSALKLYQAMLQSNCEPDARTYVGLFVACSSLAGDEESVEICGRPVRAKSLEVGFSLHSRAVATGFESDIFISNSAIDMYTKCGSMHDSRAVFDKMELHDVVSWTSLILGYAENGEEQGALELIDCMVDAGCVPNARTYVAALMACANLAVREEGEQVDGSSSRPVKLRSLERGMILHARAGERGYESDVFLASTLVDMYSKCGSLGDAYHVFVTMPKRDVVTWNALMLGYVANGEPETALELFSWMKTDGCMPDARSFVAGLTACACSAAKGDAELKLKLLERGISIHSEAREAMRDTETLVSSALVEMYVKCGSVQEAWNVFRLTRLHTVTAWNSMISGYVDIGEADRALKLFQSMDDCEPDAQTYVAALTACASLASEEAVTSDAKARLFLLGRDMHRKAESRGFDTHAFVATTLVDMYAKCGELSEARTVFDTMATPNIVAWNALIQGYAENEQEETALELFNTRILEPNERTYVAALVACASLAVKEAGATMPDGKLLKMHSLEQGRSIHSGARDSGFDSNTFVANTLIDMYSKCGSTREARKAFDTMQFRSTVSWNALLLGYAVNGESDSALEMYARMRAERCTPDARTFLALFMASANSVALEAGRELHAEVVRYDVGNQPFVTSSLVDFYGNCGAMAQAQHVFDTYPIPRDTVLWNSLLSKYSRQGDTERVFELFEKMQDEHVEVGVVTFTSILAVCSHAGLVDKGKEVFDIMCVNYDIKPDIEHYQCMIDLLGRANRLGEALTMVKNMPYEATVVTWTTVLSACEKWRNVEVGRIAFEELVKIDDKHGPAYSLMANIYSSVDQNLNIQ